ncbi:MAG: hypothetical protein AAGG68_25965 [Bacteroidota bacterium]
MESATIMPKDELKTLMKAAIIEVLAERKEWFGEIFHEVIEDYCLGSAIAYAYIEKTFIRSFHNDEISHCS